MPDPNVSPSNPSNEGPPPATPGTASSQGEQQRAPICCLEHAEELRHLTQSAANILSIIDGRLRRLGTSWTDQRVTAAGAAAHLMTIVHDILESTPVQSLSAVEHGGVAPLIQPGPLPPRSPVTPIASGEYLNGARNGHTA